MSGPFYDFGSTLVTGSVAAASVTAATAGTAITIATCTSDHKIIMVTNDLDKAVWLTYNGVKAIRLPASTPCAIDLSANHRELRATKIIGVYHDGAQPTSGTIAVMMS